MTEGYDAGEALSGGVIVLDNITLRPIRHYSPEQIAAFDRLVGVLEALTEEEDEG
jgi:hypothetical protein